MLEAESRGGRPVDRPRQYQEVERRWRRVEKKTRYYRRYGRGTKVREGVFIIPPTPNSLLAKEMQKICEEELRGSNISMSVQERGGRRLGQELGITVPGGSSKDHCRREKCFTCNTGQEGVCRRTGAGYNITCTICENTIKGEYAGETGKNLFMRGLDYVKDVEKKRTKKPLWKHIVLPLYNEVRTIP